MPVSMTEMESPALPPALREALEKEIGSRREGELAKAAAELSRRYRLESPGAKGRYLTTAGEVFGLRGGAYARDLRRCLFGALGD